MEPKSNLVVIDVETTGDNPFVHDVLSLALVPLTGVGEPLVVHVLHDDPKWTQVGRRNFQLFSSAWRREAVPPVKAFAAIQDWVRGSIGGSPVTLVGHNVGFDMAFLRKLAWQAGHLDLGLFAHRSIDTHTLLYLGWLEELVPEEALTSDGAFEAFGLHLRETRHTALGDALATKALFLGLLDRLRKDEQTPRVSGVKSTAR